MMLTVPQAGICTAGLIFRSYSYFRAPSTVLTLVTVASFILGLTILSYQIFACGPTGNGAFRSHQLHHLGVCGASSRTNESVCNSVMVHCIIS